MLHTCFKGFLFMWTLCQNINPTDTILHFLSCFHWCVTLHTVSMMWINQMDPPLPRHPPSSWLRLFSSQTFSRMDTPTILKFRHYLPTCLWRWNRQSVSKHGHIKFRFRGITQKKTYNIQNMAKIWNHELINIAWHSFAFYPLSEITMYLILSEFMGRIVLHKYSVLSIIHAWQQVAKDWRWRWEIMWFSNECWNKIIHTAVGFRHAYSCTFGQYVATMHATTRFSVCI